MQLNTDKLQFTPETKNMIRNLLNQFYLAVLLQVV